MIRRLHALRLIQKMGRWDLSTFADHNVGQQLDISKTLKKRFERNNFLWKVITGDENCVYLDNPVPKRFYVDPGHPSRSITKRGIHGR